MQAVSFEDIVGGFEIRAEDFVKFIKTWYQPEDWVAVPRRNESTGRFQTLSLKARELTRMDNESLETFVFSEGESNDVYFNVCPMTEQIISETSRGNENQIARMPGLWIDLDAKEGAFETKEEIIEFLDSLPMKPTIIVDSGKGIHAYHRFAEVDVAPDKELTEAWQAYVREKAQGRAVDKTSDLARCLRAPGTVHTGKGSGVYSSVKLVRVSQSAYRVEDVRRLVSGAIERQRAARAVKRQRESLLMDGLTDPISGTSVVARAFQAATYEDYINENIDWAQILEPAGWTLNRSMHDGEREWTRPGSGASTRSAVTDYDGSNVMSLLSESEETGLADLKGITDLTKTRVLMRIHFNDDKQKMIDYIFGNGSQ